MNINKKNYSINFEKSGEDIESKNNKTIDLFDNNETTNNSNTNILLMEKLNKIKKKYIKFNLKNFKNRILNIL